MKKWFLNIAFFLSPWTVQAHQTEISSTMLVEQDNNKWVLQVRSALTAFDYAIKADYPPYATAEEFQGLVLEHLKNNIKITCNEYADILLQKGAVKLGHETSVVFEVVGVPENIKSLYVKNSSFNKINRNQSALIILKKGFDKKQFSLNKKNDYALNLKAANNQFIPMDVPIATSEVIPTNYIYAGVVLGLLSLLVLVFLWARRNQQPKIKWTI